MAETPLRALITRPRDDAAALADALRTRGIEPVIEPMLIIEPIDGTAPDLDGVQAVLFTSANGVRAFAAASPELDLPAYAVGEASARAATEAGFARVASAGGDAAALADLAVHALDPAAGALLHASGADTAGNLQGTLEAAGFTVRRAVLYRAAAATALTPETAALLRDGGIALALFFSPRTAETFVMLAGKAGVTDACGRISAVCLSQAVAARLASVRWRDVEIAATPDTPALLAAADTALSHLQPGS